MGKRKNMLLDKIKSEIDTHDIVSFDIFDTLLMRPYVKPTDVFKHMEKVENSAGFADARIKAESDARKKYPQYEDITLDEIYEEIASSYTGMKELEVKWEERVLQPNPQIQKVFEYAKTKGKKIIIVSDMYLTEKDLTRILKVKGYDGFFKLYVSSKYRKMKYSGNLFREVIQDLKVHPSQIIHFGDNLHSDYNVPQHEGMDAFHTQKPLDLLLEKDPRVLSFLDEHPDDLNISILLGLVSFIYAEEEKNYWKMLGFKYGGPAIFGYMNWMKKQLEKSDYRDVWFIARDGYTLQKVFDLLDEKKEFHTSYIYAPRVFNNLFYLPYKDVYEVDHLQGLSVVEQIIDYYKNSNSILKSESPNKIENFEDGANFIDKHLPIYQKLAEKERALYLDYLSPKLLSKKIAMVDTVSLALSSQRFLSKILGSQQISIKGYYWALPQSSMDNSGFEKYSYQKENKWIFNDWDIMEFLITAPEPPICGLKNGVPEHKKLNPEEKIRMELYPFVSEGAVKFAELALKCFDTGTLSFTAEDVAAWINKFTSIPTEWEKGFMKRVKHAYDSANKYYVPLCKPWWKNSTEIQPNTAPNTSLLVNEKYTFYLFKCIPLFKIKRKNNIRRIYILGLPILTVKKKGQKTFYRSLGLPILSIKENQKNA